MRILLADDQPNVRYALSVLLTRQSELDMVGEATDAYELEALMTSVEPDMLILDWLLPGLAEVGSIAALRFNRPELIIIALSGRPELGREAINGGADAFVSKIDPPERLLITIDRFQNQADRFPLAAKLD